MAICQIMIRDFMYGGHIEGYGVYDLVVSLDYVEGLEDDGFKLEPFHKYNLKKFKKWARKRISDLNKKP